MSSDSRERTVEFPDNLSNSIYWAELTEDGVFYYRGEPFFSDDVSIDMREYDGQWHLDGDELYSYFNFDNGEWQFHEGSGAGGFGYNSYGGLGYLGSVGHGEILAYYADYEEEIRGRMIFDGTDSFELDGEQYIRLSGDGSNLSGDDGEVSEITLDEWYYFNGDSEPSFYFNEYGEVACEYENGTKLNMPYRIEGSEIIIGEDDAVLNILIILDEQTLEDAWSGDIFALLGTW